MLAGKERLGHFDVFFSYNSKDRSRVYKIAEELKLSGVVHGSMNFKFRQVIVLSQRYST